MVLEDLIKKLESYPKKQVVVKGFNSPHSYRGYYDELAFEPIDNITVGEMLVCAKEAVGTTYTGYKGGDYKMSMYTTCYLAFSGSCGEEIGSVLLGYMLGEY
jgi:hypothetical protein